MTTPLDDDPDAVAAAMERMVDEQADAIRERLIALRTAQLLHENDTEAAQAYRDQIDRYDLDLALDMLGYVIWHGTFSVDTIARERIRRFNLATNLSGDPVAAVLEEINRA